MKAWELTFLGILLVGAAGCGGEVKQSTASGGSSGTASGGSGGAMSGGSGGTMSGGSGGTMSGGSGGTGGDTSTTTPTASGDPALAVHVLRLGDTLPSGMLSSTAWKEYGFDLDNKVSTAASADLCQPAVGANPNNVYPDGNNGIDNSFGKNVLPIFTSLSSDFSAQVNMAIDAGDFSLLFAIDGIEPGATGTFSTRLLGASFLPGTGPQWNGQDEWPIRSDTLLNGDASTPKTLFANAEVSLNPAGERVWRSNGTGDVQLVLSLAGLSLSLVLKQARIEMVLSDDNQLATRGMIGGILEADVFINEIAKLAGSFDPNLCPPSATFQSIANQIQQASDILIDGTQDPAAVCNGISIGLGFDAEGAVLGPVFDPPVAPDPCAP